MKLIVGLGNPGKEYEATRHNSGWLIVDALANRLEAGEWREDGKFESSIVTVSASPTLRKSPPQANTSEVSSAREQVVLLKPTTFMNNSGRAVERVRAYYKLDSTDIIVVHDELDLPLGTVRTRLGGQTAGHNGVGSLLHHLSTDQFWRVRVGISPAPLSLGKSSQATTSQVSPARDATNYVLQRFGADEQPLVTQIVDETASNLVEWLDTGLTETSFTIEGPQIHE